MKQVPFHNSFIGRWLPEFQTRGHGRNIFCVVAWIGGIDSPARILIGVDSVRRKGRHKEKSLQSTCSTRDACLCSRAAFHIMVKADFFSFQGYAATTSCFLRAHVFFADLI